MKFGEQLDAHIFVEWKHYYVRYRQIKDHTEHLFPSAEEKQRKDRVHEFQSKVSKKLNKLKTSISTTFDQLKQKNGDQHADASETTPLTGIKVKQKDAHDEAEDDEDSVQQLVDHERKEHRARIAKQRAKQQLHKAKNAVTAYGAMTYEHQHEHEEVKEAEEQSDDSDDSDDDGDHLSTSIKTASLKLDRNADQASTAHNHSAHFSSLHYNDYAHDGCYLADDKEKLDQIIVKVVNEIHKVDSFYRAMEEELVAGYKALKTQVDHVLNPVVSPFSHKIRPRKLPAALSNDAMPRSAADSSNELQQNNQPQRNATVPSAETNTEHSESHNAGIDAIHHVPSSSAFSASGNGTASEADGNGMHRISSNSSFGTLSPDEADKAPQQPAANSNAVLSADSSQSLSKQHIAPPAVTINSNNQSAHHIPPRWQHKSLTPSSSNPQLNRLPSSTSTSLLPLRHAFLDLLRRETMLVHFVDINLLAFRKVLKNLEKRSGFKGIQSKLMSNVKSRYFAKSSTVDEELIPATYQLFADCFEKGDVESAKIVLLNRMTESKYNRRDSFVLGAKIGVMMMLLIWTFLALLHPLPHTKLHRIAAFSPVYRSIGMLLVILWLWATCVYIFDQFRISYVFVFQLNPRTRLTHYQLINEATNMTIFYLCNALLLISHYDHKREQYISSLVYPLALFVYTMAKLFAPPWLSVFSYWSTRKTLLQTLWNVIIAPFGKVKFRETYVGDVLTSMVKVLVDIYAGVVLYCTGSWLNASKHQYPQDSVSKVVIPIICALPLYWRFMQCLRRYLDTRNRWPHLANALKYALAHTVIIVSMFHPNFSNQATTGWQTYRTVWLACYIITTLYTIVWDITQDWGLFSRSEKTPHGYWLRDTLVYGDPAIYYAAIFVNVVLRFFWCVTLIPYGLNSKDSVEAHTAGVAQSVLSWMFSFDYALLPALMLAELVRRFIWTLFRVEYEQISHGTGFRYGEYIPVHFQHQQQAAADAGERASDNHTEVGMNVVLELVTMAGLLIVVAVIGAVL